MYKQLNVEEFEEKLQLTNRKDSFNRILEVIEKVIELRPERYQELVESIELISNDILYNDSFQEKAVIS